MALKVFLVRRNVLALLPTGFGKSLVNHCSLWWGGDTHLMLSLTPIGSFELLLTGLSWPAYCNWQCKKKKKNQLWMIVKDRKLVYHFPLLSKSSSSDGHIKKIQPINVPLIIWSISCLTSVPGKLLSKAAPVPGFWPPGPPGHWECSSCTGPSSTARTDPCLESPALGTASVHQAWMLDSQKTPAENDINIDEKYCLKRNCGCNGMAAQNLAYNLSVCSNCSQTLYPITLN